MNIDLLRERNRQEVMDFLMPERALNLFIIGDIETFGFDSKFQQVWGDFSRTGKLRAVLLAYHGSFIPYAPGSFDAAGLAAIILLNHRSMVSFSGAERVVKRFEVWPEILPAGAVRRPLILAELKDDKVIKAYTESRASLSLGASKPDPALSGLLGPIRATAEDIPDVVRFWRGIEEFSRSLGNVRRNQRELEMGASRIYFLRKAEAPAGKTHRAPAGKTHRASAGKAPRASSSGSIPALGPVVATVKTTAENRLSAMITGVATHSRYRRSGLATRLLTHLCAELTAEGKTPCLLYDNPEAAAIYRRLGFRKAGNWILYAK